MIDINNVTNITDTKLQLTLEKFTKLIIDSANFEVDIEETDKQILLNNNIITNNSNNKYKVNLSYILIYNILRNYEQRGEFTFSNDINDWKSAENKLHEIKGSLGLINEFYSFVLRYVDAFYPLSLNSIIFSDESKVWYWVKALNSTISLLQISPTELYKLVKSVTEKYYSNMAISQLYGAVRQYCQNDYGKGNELMNLSLVNLDCPLNNIVITCMSGLLDNDYTKAKEQLLKLSENEDLKPVITCALSFAVIKYPDNSKELYDIVCSFHEFRNISVLKFYWEIHRLNDGLQQQCELKLIDIIDNANESVLNSGIEQLLYLEDITNFIRDYIDHIIINEHFTIEYVTILDRSLNICDTLMLRDIIRKISDRFGMRVRPNMLENCIRNVSEKEPKDFAYGVVSLITDNQGIIRHIGRNIWDSSNLINSDFDVLSLSEEMQLSFIVSMLQDYGNPNNRLKKILLLFDSQYQLVPKLLLRQLIPYIDNYMGSVTKELDSLSLKNNEEIVQLKEYFKNRCNFIDKRMSCKEMDPFYTQCKVLDEFQRGHQEYMKGVMKQTEQDHKLSLLGLFPPVLLAKGGGFRDERGKVQKLAHISHSIPFPAMCAGLSEIEERELKNKIFADWDKVTDIWKIL